MDPEDTKTDLLCKWIVKAMELDESNLQLMLGYRLARFNPQSGQSWGVSLEWFTSKKHQGFLALRCGATLIINTWKVMVKGIYQIPPCIRMDLLHSNIWGSHGVELIGKGIAYSKGLHLYREGICCVDDIWDSTQ